MRQIFELCGGNRDVQFSPFCWVTRLCLKHKGLDVEVVPVKFLEKEPFAESGSTSVPVLKDGDKWVSDSFEIAKYLEATYEGPSLFGGAMGEALAPMLRGFIVNTALAKLFPMLAADVCRVQDEENAAYFRQTREPRLGRTLEEAATTRDTDIIEWRKTLAPIRLCLEANPYLCGDAPAFMDYVLFAVFKWAHTVSDFELLEKDDILYAWRERMMDLYDGYARKAARLQG